MPYITVRLTQENLSKKIKLEIIEEITEIICRKLNKDSRATTVIIEEIPLDNWGIAGMQAAEFRKSPLFWGNSDHESDEIELGKQSTRKNTNVQAVAENFGREASGYLSSVDHAKGSGLEELEIFLQQHSFQNAIDIGCGAGHVSLLAAKYVDKVVAYDLTQEMLDVVSTEAEKRGLNNIITCSGKAEEINFPDDNFDLVLTRFSAHHWESFESGLKEIYRILKPGGSGVFIDITAPDYAKADTHLQTIELLRDNSHVRDYSKAKWLAQLNLSGFIVEKTFYTKLNLVLERWLARMSTPEYESNMIRKLQAKAPKTIAEYFAINKDGDFSMDVSVFVVKKS